MSKVFISIGISLDGYITARMVVREIRQYAGLVDEFHIHFPPNTPGKACQSL